jgi:enoyl-CoA hydratase/carnithine racemase
MVLSCDFRIAHKDARLGPLEVDIGQILGVGGVQMLRELASPAIARKIAMLGEYIRFDNRPAEIADQIANGPTKIFGRIVRLFDETYAQQLPDQLAAETEQVASTVRTDDYLEGVSAFKDKQEPEFTSR